MATTTQILFNSPALHSLKREQLMKLCKIHSIKTAGNLKKADLIERLKQRAHELPPEALSVVERYNDDDEVTSPDEDQAMGMLPQTQLTRPSEQWEVVMDDIEEIDEQSSMGTMTSMKSLRSNKTAGEFGTGSSKTSVSSSIKAIATSLGIKRAGTSKSTSSKTFPPSATSKERATDELAQHAVPYSSLPPSRSLPQTDDIKFSTPDATFLKPADDDIEPIPGNPTRLGVPAPANARLSTGAGVTTTIRLITSPYKNSMPSPPHLAPFQTTFDLVMGSPGGDALSKPVNVWPASPANYQRLYPALPLDDFKSPSRGQTQDVEMGTPGEFSVPQPKVSHVMPSEGPEDIFSPVKPSAARVSVARNEPFLFGSPLPQHRLSNHDFGQAAASVLTEMNKRLADAGVQKVDSKLMEGTTGGVGNLFTAGSSVQTHQRTDSGDRYAKVHEDVFNKMDSITSHYAARRPAPAGQSVPGSKKRKSDAIGMGPAPGGKRKTSAAAHTGTRVISNGVRRNMGLPGAFGDEDEEDEQEEEEDAGDRRSSKRIRVTQGEDVHKGKRVSIVATAPVGGNHDEDREKEERRKERERDAVRRKLEASKARRRSSRGRVSVGGKASAAAATKGKTSRFGFLSSAKSLVRNVWNMGAGKPAAPAPTSSIPIAKAQPITKTGASGQPSTTTHITRKTSVSNINANAKSSAASATASSATNGFLKAPVSKPAAKSSGTMGSSTSSSRSRSPIPPFAPSGHIRTSSITSSKASVPTGTAASRAGTAKNSSIAGASSMGTRNSLAVNTGAASSMGVRPRVASNASAGFPGIGTAGSKRSLARPSSTLLAPTASSLAKMQGNAAKPSGLPQLAARKATSPVNNTAPLGQITNSPQSPRAGRIFSKPLATFGSPSSPSHPAGNPSLTAAGISLGAPLAPKAAVPPKPKTLVARKPRISRSRVIAKLGAQRAAAGSSSTAAIAPSSRIRSSMGGARRSLGGVKAKRTSATGDVLMSAKKRARQSEYAARRRSRITTGGSNGLKSPRQGASDAMDVDD